MTYATPGRVMPTPPVISTCSLFSSYWGSVAGSQAAPTSSTGIAANQAIYIPFIVTETTIFQRGFWYNGSNPGNYTNACVGIYDEAGTRQATTGAVAAGTASVIQTAAFSANVTLAPGTYYMAIEFSASGVNAQTAFAGSLIHGKASGFYTQAVGAHPLPATATFATWSSQVVPFFGIAATSFAI